MIVARWQGFEIDSSEGYYVFAQEMQHIDDGWVLLSRLLSSPLVWQTVGFDFRPNEGREGNVEKILAEGRKKGRIRVKKLEEDSSPRDTIRASDFLSLFKEVRAELEAASVRFAMVPPRLLNSYSYKKLRQWFLRQFDDEETAKVRWSGYCRVKESDLKLLGHTDMSDFWTDAMGLEATFEIRLRRPFEYKVFVPAVDPTMIVYLLRSLTDQFYLIFEGEHYISINLTPDYLSIARIRPEPGAKEFLEIMPGPGKSLRKMMEHRGKKRA
jgi:hypothetical protein